MLPASSADLERLIDDGRLGRRIGGRKCTGRSRLIEECGQLGLREAIRLRELRLVLDQLEREPVAGPDGVPFGLHHVRRLEERQVTGAHDVGEDEGGGARERRHAVDNADCVMTDKWISMGDKGNLSKKRKAFKNFQVNEKLMKIAKKDAIFMHDLPAQRGEEVSAGVIDGKQSVVWQQAENRLHCQKGIIEWCLKGK